MDNSGSMTTSTINPSPDYPYTEFKNWIVTNYPNIIIRLRDVGPPDPNAFIDERWVNEMKIQVQSVLDKL